MKKKLKHQIDSKAFDKDCTEVFCVLSLLLDQYRFYRQDYIPQDVVRDIHTVALFNCLKEVNSTAPLKMRIAYRRFAETLRPKFFEIVEALRNFQFTGTLANNLKD